MNQGNKKCKGCKVKLSDRTRSFWNYALVLQRRKQLCDKCLGSGSKQDRKDDRAKNKAPQTEQLASGIMGAIQLFFACCLVMVGLVGLFFLLLLLLIFI